MDDEILCPQCKSDLEKETCLNAQYDYEIYLYRCDDCNEFFEVEFNAKRTISNIVKADE